MTPYEIEVLLWYYTRTADHPDMTKQPPVWTPTMAKLIRLQLLQLTPYGTGEKTVYAITDRGEAHVDGLKKLPFPKLAWVTDCSEAQQ